MVDARTVSAAACLALIGLLWAMPAMPRKRVQVPPAPTTKDLDHLAMRLEPSYDFTSSAERYAGAYDPMRWGSLKNNEIVRDGYLSVVESLMKERAAAVPLPARYRLINSSDVTAATYDSASSGFTLQGMANGESWKFVDRTRSAEYVFWLTNASEFNLLTMDRAAAAEFIQVAVGPHRRLNIALDIEVIGIHRANEYGCQEFRAARPRCAFDVRIRKLMVQPYEVLKDPWGRPPVAVIDGKFADASL